MNLSDLRPAWQRSRSLNSMQLMDRQEILSIVEYAEEMAVVNTRRYLVSAVMFVVLIFCCQGG